jgi:hypothetical protein
MQVNFIDSASNMMGQATALANTDTSGMTPEQLTNHNLQMQLKMSMATATVTAASEVVKSMGEAQKSISKNMGA